MIDSEESNDDKWLWDASEEENYRLHRLRSYITADGFFAY
jgi:hypothetical protein